MKILVILFCFVIGLVQCRLHDNCWLQCDWAPYKAKITCPETGECACLKNTDGIDSPDCGIEVTGDNGPKTWDACWKIANANTESSSTVQNTHFRWENKDKEGNTICYLLTECQHVSDTCVPFETAPCVSGPSTTGCDADPSPVCKPPKWNDNGLHWVCVDAEDTPINPYETEDPEAAFLPANAQCKTSEKCSTWEWMGDDQGEKIARVKCGTDKWESIEGFALKNQEETPILPDEDAANDAECKCNTLVLEDGTLETDGLTLLCDDILIASDAAEPGILNGIGYENSCTLLCDNHFVMYIECYRGVWVNTAIYPFEPVLAADIKC